jgi:putative exosortase-associated protein (TIGR04073 family)
MTNKLASVIMCLIVLGCCSDACAANPVNKLARGIINIPTSIIEIPNAYIRSKERLDAYGQKYPDEFLTPVANTPFQYLVKAPLTGIAAMVGRICIGCYDVVTFPFALPRHYAPVYEPEFVFDTMPYAFKIYNQGVTYIGRGQQRRAIARFTRALEVDPANAQALYNRGKAYESIDQYRKSVDDLNAAESLGFHPELENVTLHNDRY